MSAWARRGRAGVAAVLLVMAPVVATFTSSPAAAADGDPPPALVVALTALRPVAPQAGQTLVLTGTVHNATSAAVSDVSVQLRMSGAVGSRSDFDDYASDPSGVLPLTLAGIPQAQSVVGPRLLPGATEPFRISVDVDSLGLPQSWQVSKLGVLATATTATGITDTGSLRTFLPWAPRTVTSTPVHVAWVWPLVDRPHRALGNNWIDDSLAPELGAHGRLGQLVAAANAAEHPALRPSRRRHHRKTTPRGVPVTWALDPLLVEDATLMTKGYTVRGAGGHAVPGTGRTVAGQWLAALHAGVADSEVIPLPYADTDLVAAVRAGLGGEAGVATASGRNSLAHALPTSTLLQTAWPVDGFADQATLNRLFGMGISSVLLSSDALPIIGGEPPVTPSARKTILTDTGSLNGMLIDSGLSDTVNQGASDPASTELDLQRFLAETLMIQAEAPNDPRSLVVAPDQQWAPSAGYADALLADSGHVPWIDPVRLSRVLHSPVYTKVTRGPLEYPTTERRAELRPQYLHQVHAVKSQLVGFGTVLSAGTSTVAGYDAGLQRLLSSGYRDDVPAREQALAAVRQSLDAQMGRVSIATHTGSFITLTSHNGTVPLTISNTLDTPVHVVLQVNANQRLVFDHGGRTQETIPANTQLPVTVRAVAKTSGVFPLEVRLLTPGLHRYGPTKLLYVRSTAYGTITLVITAAATLALLIAVAIRLFRRARAARRSTTAGT